MVKPNKTTQQKVEQLKESRELFQIVFNNSAAAITVTDKEELIVAWNPFAEKMLGMSKKDLFNKPVKDLYPPKEWKKMRALQIRRKGMLSDIETQVFRKDGSLIDVNISISVVKDINGNILGSIGIMNDLTNQKKTQQMLVEAKKIAEEANSTKSMFLANVSHEVRTPMNTIIGMVDLTLDTELNEEQRENLNTVKDAAEDLLSLINDILDLSRVESGKIELEKIPLNVRNVVKSTCKGLSVLAQSKNLELTWSVDEKAPRMVLGDPIRIRQVLVNLMNNAIKFTFEGKIVVGVKLLSEGKGEYELQFSVTDQGVGIPKEKVGNIFEVFTQADTSTTRRFGGTGLGLAISKRLVELMGGKMWVESEEFKGSTFFFKIKFPESKGFVPDLMKDTTQEKDFEAKRKTAGPVTILLAEDNIVNQKMAARLLEKKGWKVTAVDNGKEVLKALEKGTYNVILMDAQMPVLDGYETTRLIREKEKKSGGHIPIIALTARAMTGDRKRCLDAGMDSYVAKPIDREKLYQAVEDAV